MRLLMQRMIGRIWAALQSQSYGWAARAGAAQVDGDEFAASDRFEINVVPNAIHIKTPAEP